MTTLRFATDSEVSGDGMPDAYELRYGLNFEIDNADLDSDGDGLSDTRIFDGQTLVQVGSDRDGDGVLDFQDVFPDEPSEWLDSDEDGVGDNSDNCLYTPNPDQTDTDGDGDGNDCDVDDDDDGVVDVTGSASLRSEV